MTARELAPPDETLRLAALASYGILDTPPEDDFDWIASLAAQVCETSIGTVSFFDAEREWFKASLGFDIDEIPLAESIGMHGIANDGLMVMADTSLEERVSHTAQVAGPPGIRFYAGAPLVTDDGFSIGMLAVADTHPRQLPASARDALQGLAKLVMSRLESRRQSFVLRRLQDERNAMAQAVRAQANVLQFAGQLARLGGFEVDLLNRTIALSDEARSVLGLAEPTVSLAQAAQAFAPEDRPRLSVLFHACVDERRGFDEEMEVVGQEGRQWLRVIVRPAPAAGAAERLWGAVQNISDRKALEARLVFGARTRMGVLAILQEFASSALPLDQLMATMANRVGALMQASGAEVDLLEHGRLVCHGASGSTTGGVGFTTSLEGLSGLAVSSGQPAVSLEVETDERVEPSERTLGARSLAVMPMLEDGRVIGVIRVSYTRPNAVDDRELSILQMLATAMGSVIERRRIADALQTSEQRYRLLFERNPHAMYIYDPTTLRILASNDSAVQHYGYTAAELIGTSVAEMVSSDRPLSEIEKAIRSVPLFARTANVRSRHKRKDGGVIDVELSGHGVVFGGRPARLVAMVDISERVQAEQHIMQLARAQQMLSASNEAVIRADNRDSLLHKICQIAVDIGGYRAAWVGLAQNDEEKSVVPVAMAGEGAEVIRQFGFSWSAGVLAGQGTVGKAIRGQIIASVSDIEGEPASPLRDDIRRHFDARGVISLPLRDGHPARAFGVLGLFSSAPVYPGSEELVRMGELADNLAFGITTLRARDQQRKLQDAVVHVATAVTNQVGTRFFDDLVRHLATTIGARSCVVAQLLPGSPPSGRTIAAYVAGEITGPLELAVEGSPFQALLDRELVVVDAGLNRKFPGRFDAYEAFAGIRLNDSTGSAIGMLALFFDEALSETALVENTLKIFSTRAAAELERQHFDAQLRAHASLLDKARDAILVRDMAHHVLFWNKSCERLYGYSREEAMGRSELELLYRGDGVAFLPATAQLLANGEWAGELTQWCKSGLPVIVEARWNLVRDEQTGAVSALCINTDVSAEKQAEQAVHRASFYDALTGLPNRRLFEQQLQQAIGDVLTTGQCGAVLFLNIDKFAIINKSLGHVNGDRLLRQAGQRLADQLRETGTVARLGGDEFLLLLPRLGTSVVQAREAASRAVAGLIGALGVPFALGNYEQAISASVGITIIEPGDAPSADTVLQHVDLALAQAKKEGRSSVVFFDPSLQRVLAEQTALEADLAQALLRNEMALHYQPQLSREGRLFGAEALLRWRNATRGMVSPADFIPLAEETGLILQIGQWVLQSACATLGRWRSVPELAHMTVSVNVSIAQFQQRSFVHQVIDALQDSGASPEQLKLELTESMLAHDVEGVVDKMRALRSFGVRFSMDDFGTGYSSLSYLKRMPLDQLKIDQSFVRDLFTDANGAAIARTIIALAHSMGLAVVAEGVETAQQRDWLFAHACDAFQGYLFSRPVPVDQLEAMMRSNE